MTHDRDRIRWLLGHPCWVAPIRRDREGESKSMAELLGDVDYLPHGGFWDCVEVIVTHVNPETESIDDDDEKNTQFEIWLEGGMHYDMANNGAPTGGLFEFSRYALVHDLRLDCGGPSLHAALLAMADLVEEHFGPYTKGDWVEWHRTHHDGLLSEKGQK
jgi:hypothetical protein